jgi:hypothetical protein
MSTHTRTYSVLYTAANSGVLDTIELSVELAPGTKTSKQIEEQVRDALALKVPGATYRSCTRIFK